MAISDEYFYVSHGLKVTKGCEGCQLIKEAYDKGYNEVMRKASLLLPTMREVTPEEREALKKAIRDMSYDTGVTLQGLLDHEKYVPISVLEDIKTEIKDMVVEFELFGITSDYINIPILMDILDKYIS